MTELGNSHAETVDYREVSKFLGVSVEDTTNTVPNLVFYPEFSPAAILKLPQPL